MKLIDKAGKSRMEVTYMWLPAWLAMNSSFIKELQEALSKEFLGKALTDQTLDEANQFTLRYIQDKFSHIEGLIDYLDGLKFVHIGE